jgi:histidine ammonia-lyase
MQGAQFAAVSTTAENQTLSNPMYVHSVPNNNDNQDIVSMGTNAALMAKTVIENTFEILAVEFLSIVQAIDYLKITDKLALPTNKVYKQIRDIVPVFVEDTPKYSELKKIKEFLLGNNPEVI